MNLCKFLGSLLFTIIVSTPTFAQTISGIMMVVKGDIKVTSKDGKTELGKVGKKVSQGDTITAGADSRAKVVMSDKNVINVSPDTKITIEKYTNDGKEKKEVELNVVYGKIRASVEQKYDGEKSKFNIKTPSAVAGVRGTDFITGYNPTTQVSQIITFSGTVAVGTPGPNGSIQNPVFVNPGQMTEAGQGKSPQAPKPIPADELNKLNSETKADTTATKKDSPSKEAKSEVKEQEKKSDTKETDSSASTGPKKEPAADSASSGNESRTPANSDATTATPAANSAPARSPSMFDPAMDNPGSKGNLILPTTGPGLFTSFPPPIAPQPLPSQFIGDAIRNSQKAKTTIILNPQ